MLGGCVCHGIGRNITEDNAHAHVGTDNNGWLCFKSNELTKIKELWFHELAHLICDKKMYDLGHSDFWRVGHSDFWRQTVLDIGGTLDAVYLNGNLIMNSYYSKTYKPNMRWKVVKERIAILKQIRQMSCGKEHELLIMKLECSHLNGF